MGNLAFYRLTPNWRNSGNTPTSNALISTNWSPSPGGPPPDFSYGDDAQATFIGPGAEVGSKFIDVPAHVIEQAAKGIERIFIWGTIEYRDIFEGTPPRFTNFCFHMDVRADPHTDDRWIGYVPHVGHNDTDLDRRKIKAPEGVFQSWIAGIVDVKQPH